MGKSASDILIERFLKDVDETNSLPWQRPYKCYNSVNYFSRKAYRGFNRLLLPSGQYLTRNQINQYNKTHGTDFKFKKGIVWYPIMYFNTQEYGVSEADMLGITSDIYEEGYICTDGTWRYYNIGGNSWVKRRNYLKYYYVAERKFFEDSNGNLLPDLFEGGILELTYSKPQEVFENYVNRSKVSLDMEYTGVPCYIPSLDKVCLNKYTSSEKTWFSTAFHELAHSTGAKNRLNREGVVYKKGVSHEEKDRINAVEECIAEIASSLCCAECNIMDFETSASAEYSNSVAYVQGWKKRIQDFGSSFFYICSQADKAFDYITGADSESIKTEC